MLWLDNIRQVLWFSVIPAAITLAIILFGIHEPASGTPSAGQAGSRFHMPVHWQAVRSFPRAYWWIVLIGAVFSLARFSEAFLILAGQRSGLAPGWVPIVLVVMSLFYTLSAYPAGILSDRVRRSTVLSLGLLLLIVADLILAQADTIALTLVGVAIWGLHMGFTQGILAAMVADATPATLKGTAFGLFNLVTGILLFVSSVAAGWLWQYRGPMLTFDAGAAFAAITCLLLLARPQPRQ
jgi:MFS family permease